MNTRSKRTLNMRNSMSVHTLIDKFQANDGGSDKKKPETINRPASTPLERKETDDAKMDIDKDMDEKELHRQRIETNTATTGQSGSSERTSSSPAINLDQGLLSLLGANINSFPYTEEAYIESIKLKCQQEITKQQYYKIELANKNLAIIHLASRVNIPADLIAKMCIDHETNLQDIEDKIRLINQNSDSSHSRNISLPNIANYANLNPQNPQNIPISNIPNLSNIPQPINHPASHSHSKSNPQSYQVHSYSPENTYLRKRSSGTGATGPGTGVGTGTGAGTGSGGSLYHDAINSSVPPMNYRFGSGTNTRRPLSPAKIGAQAVANLATPTTPYRQPTSHSRRTRLSTSHQRHSSMPSEKELSNQAISSPMGGTSTIQVKPLPAQPLTKSNRQPPSQESMTSFQHIIQFHHWKPESGGSNSNTGNTIFKTHKRHKSSSEVTPRSIQENSNSLSLKQENIPNLQANHHQTSTPIHTPKINITDTSSKRDEDTIDDISIDDTEIETSRIIPTDSDPNKSIMENNVDATPREKGSPRNIGRYPHDILSG